MALVKYGGGIVQMSGSIAGSTHARNRFGNYIRSRTKPVNPKSSRQVAARVAMMFLAEQWREAPMTDEFRTAWQTYANSVNWLNRLGESVTLTGFNMFMRYNSMALRVGNPIVTAGPEDLGLPGGDPEFSIDTATAAGGTVMINFDDTQDWVTEDDGYLAIDMGVPQNATRNFFNGPWRFWQGITGIDPGGRVSPEGPWGNLPFTLVEGQKIWFRASILRADGRVSTKFECDPVIVAA